ncbi:MAG: hypothetical protein ACRDPW_07725 [Mycobacteriales bacterium]
MLPANGTVKALKGVIAAPELPVTLEEMEAAAADGAAVRSLR